MREKKTTLRLFEQAREETFSLFWMRVDYIRYFWNKYRGFIHSNFPLTKKKNSIFYYYFLNVFFFILFSSWSKRHTRVEITLIASERERKIDNRFRIYITRTLSMGGWRRILGHLSAIAVRESKLRNYRVKKKRIEDEGNYLKMPLLV